MPSPQPLAPEQVRWFSFRAAWDPADAAKLQDSSVPHRGSLLRFAACDSAALEAAFRCAAGARLLLWRPRL